MIVKEKVLDKELASLGYGYGIKISPFQIASAYSVFANDGVMKDFQIFKKHVKFYVRTLDRKNTN